MAELTFRLKNTTSLIANLNANDMKALLKNKVKNLKGKTGLDGLRAKFGNTGKIVEMLLFAVLIPVLGLVLFSSDPLGLKSGFPWACAAPVVFAARYGSSWGAACAAVAAITFFLIGGTVYEASSVALLTLAVGTLIMCVVIGDVAEAWRGRTGRAEAENEYLRHRLKEFSNDYHILKVSHGQLEEFMAGQRLSLRQALQQAKPMLTAGADGLEAGSDLMAIFAQFCSVQVAGLYAMKNQTELDPTAVAVHGNMGELPVFDPLLKLAIEERELVSVKLSSHATDNHESGLLAVVPLVDAQGKLHGVLAVRDMHFMAFQQENLNIIALLGGYVGDMLTRSRGAAQSRTAWFMAELDTALRFARKNSVTSSLLCLEFEDTEYVEQVSEMVSTNIRSLDSSWIPKTKDGKTTVVILLPLIAETQCNAYLRRIGESVRTGFDLELQDLLSDVTTKQLSGSDTRETCIEFINQSTGFGTSKGEVPAITQRRLKRVA